MAYTDNKEWLNTLYHHTQENYPEDLYSFKISESKRLVHDKVNACAQNRVGGCDISPVKGHPLGCSFRSLDGDVAAEIEKLVNQLAGTF